MIVGSKCFLSYTCTATKDDDSVIAIGGADNIELKEGAANLLVDTINIKISGQQVHSDSQATITRHWYERLANTKFSRIAGANQDRIIGGDANIEFGTEATPALVSTTEDPGIRVTAITGGKTFKLERPLTECAFFGPRDSAIPASLPISINTKMNSPTGVVFNTLAATVASPKLFINQVELWVYSVEMETVFSTQIQEALRSDSLTGTADDWISSALAASIGDSQSVFSNPGGISIETIPDVFGICFMPYTVAISSAWKGDHPMKTDWLNTSDMNIKFSGKQIRTWDSLGGNADVGSKNDMLREMKEMSGGGVLVGLGESAIDTTVYANGKMSFFPIAMRTIDESSVLQPTPVNITVNSRMFPDSSLNSSVQVFYKLRHQWRLSSQSGRTSIIK